MSALAFPLFTRARRARAEGVARDLRSGVAVADETFDAIYPAAVRRASPVHWTPVRVCARVLELLELPPRSRVIDVGAGAGKFCIVAAAMGGLSLRGVERQSILVDVAREAARRLGIDVELVEGSFEAEDPERFEAAYLFNPFRETIRLPGMTAEGGTGDVAAAERFLAAARGGMRVITFCGFGGSMPTGYERLAQETWEGGVLELWEKRV